jgi:hypothetical protein
MIPVTRVTRRDFAGATCARLLRPQSPHRWLFIDPHDRKARPLNRLPQLRLRRRAIDVKAESQATMCLLDTKFADEPPVDSGDLPRVVYQERLSRPPLPAQCDLDVTTTRSHQRIDQAQQRIWRVLTLDRRPRIRHNADASTDRSEPTRIRAKSASAIALRRTIRWRSPLPAGTYRS